MKSKFTVQEIEESIGPDWDTETYPEPEKTDVGEAKETDLRGAIDALHSQCWDHIEQRSDGTLICYPADGDTNYSTGYETRTTVIIKSRRPEWANWLMENYDRAS